MIKSVLKLECQIVCYLLLPAAWCLGFTVWGCFFFCQRTISVYPEFVDFCATDKFILSVQDFFFFFLAHFKFSSSWSSMSWIPLCSIKISWVLVAKNMCYIMSNDTAPRTMGQRWKNWFRKKIIISLLLGGRKTLESVRIQLFILSLCVCLKCRENTKQIGFQTTGELLVLQAVSVSSSTDK